MKSLARLLADPRYSEREELADARNLLGRSYQLQRKFTAALEAWREYLAKHPSHHAWSDVQRAIVDTEFLMAADKAQAKQFDAARKLWTEFLIKYPLDPRDPSILYSFGLMDYQQEKYAAAIELLGLSFVGRHQEFGIDDRALHVAPRMMRRMLHRDIRTSLSTAVNLHATDTSDRANCGRRPVPRARSSAGRREQPSQRLGGIFEPAAAM